MPELRKDPVVGRWIVFSPERQIRPERFRCEELAPTPSGRGSLFGGA